MRAHDFVRPSETAIAVFTDGIHLTINPDGTGSTGWWIMDPERDIDHVIIYRRDPILRGTTFISHPTMAQSNVAWINAS